MSTPPPDPRASRRDFLSAGASLLGATALAGPACAAPHGARASALPANESDDDRLDRALERVAARFPDRNVHRSNHAPMVAEALRVLGRADAIAPWLDRNLEDFQRAPEVSERIERERWREALARPELYASWQAFFLAEIEGEGGEAVLRRWVPRLAPGLAGAATHGLIRTGHGARALAARDGAIRRRELATGLAYWAIQYEELPWDGSSAPEPSIEAALAKVETRLPAREAPRGNIVAGLRALGETPSFRTVAGLADTRDPLQTLSEITSAFARLYLRNPDRRIAFTHAVTAPSALRLLVPYLDEATVRAGVRYAWQAAAGIHVVYGDPRRPAPPERTAAARETLIARAVETGGAHAIKLTEACLREEAVSHDALLLAAAQDAGEWQTS